MDSGFLDLLKGVSPLQILVIVALALVGLRWARRVIREDNLEALGLEEGETLDSKINRAVAEGFEASVHPLTVALQAQTEAITAARVELQGVRIGLSNHGERLGILEVEVASLTTLVSGPTAVHALRARLERRRAAAAERSEDKE